MERANRVLKILLLSTIVLILFKKLNDNIWEFRTLYKSIAYRLFAFWDKTNGGETLVLATHGIIKKTNNTPPKEIEKAENIRKQYFERKNKK